MSELDFNYADKLTKKDMGELTQSKKLVTLHGLAKYNRELITKLGLTNDTAGYAYAESTAKGKTVGEITKATNVKEALDQLYDLIAAGGTGLVSIASGKSTAAEGKTVSEAVFTKVGTDTDKEEYYVNFTDAQGNVTNVKLDAEAFVKDGVIAGGQVIYGPSTGVTDVTAATITGTQTWADVLPTNGSKTKTTDAPDAYIELVVKNAVDPDATQTYSTISIKTSDLLGDLVGGDGIDINNGTVKVDLADQTANTKVNLSLDGDTAGSKKLNVNVKAAADSTTFTARAGETPAALTISTIAEADNGVVDNTELANALTDVKSYIDAKDAEKSVTVADAANSDAAEAIGTTKEGIYVTSTTGTDGSTSYSVGANVANDDEIAALFV